MTTEALVRPDAEAPARGSPAARPRSARGVSKRVFARLDQAGIPGAADTLAPQRLVAFFGDLAPRELSDKQRERYRAMVGACGLPAAQADTDLALLTPSAPLGAPLPDLAWAAGPHDPRAAAAIPVAPAPGPSASPTSTRSPRFSVRTRPGGRGISSRTTRSTSFPNPPKTSRSTPRPGRSWSRPGSG